MKYLTTFRRWFTVARAARCVLGGVHLFTAMAVIHTLITLTGGWGWWAPLAALVLVLLLEWWAVNSCDESGYAFYTLERPYDDDSEQATNAADEREKLEQQAEAAYDEKYPGARSWNYAQWKRDHDHNQGRADD